MTREEIESQLARVTLAPTVLFDEWRFEAVPAKVEILLPPDFYWTGWFIRLAFRRPDTQTGTVDWGYGRWEWVSDDATPDSVLKTGYLLFDLIVRHEMMEAYLVDSARVFNPHRSLEAHVVGEVFDARGKVDKVGAAT